jgi:hypothetical protein
VKWGRGPHSVEASQVAEELVRKLRIGRVSILDRWQATVLYQLLHAHIRRLLAGKFRNLLKM